MRILFVLPRMVSGGVERVTLRLIAGFQAEGNDCLLALGQCRGELLDESVALVDVRDLASDGLRHFLPRLAKLVRDWQPTHVVTAFADVGLMTLIACRLAGSNAALVHGVHDTHGRETARPGWPGRLRHKAYNAMAGLVYRRAHMIVAVSKGVGHEVCAGYGIPADHVRIIYNPVIPDMLVPAQIPIRHGTGNSQRIVALGRLVRQKGFDILVRAMAQVPASLNWCVDIHGEGPERPVLEALIADLALHERVHLRGHAADPFSVLAGADVFVLPSRHEGLGNVLIEAMACGAQVVATDCRHGPREILDEGRLGLLIPPDNPQALADALSMVLAGGVFREPQLLVERAQQFTVAASCQRWLEALKDAEGGRTSRSR